MQRQQDGAGRSTLDPGGDQRVAIAEAAEIAQGRMKKKVMGAEEALNGGVKRVVIGDARVERPLSRALAGVGTVFS